MHACMHVCMYVCMRVQVLRGQECVKELRVKDLCGTDLCVCTGAV